MSISSSQEVSVANAEKATLESKSRSWVALMPMLLVALAVLINLWVLRSERLVVTAVNDQSVHRLFVEWARSHWMTGSIPFDGWFPNLSLGYAAFHHYQVLPHIITGAVATVIGTNKAMAWTNYLGMALWPICIYLTVRIFGFSRVTGGITAMLAPLISSVTLYGFEAGSYAWRGNGMWSQLWGMWLLPITLALTWRAISQGRRYALAAVFLALTFSCHFLTGTMAVLGMGVWVLLVPREIPRRIGRACLVGIGGIAGASWLLLPVASNSAWGLSSQYNGDTYFFNSHGRSQVFSWLTQGKLFDYAQDGGTRLPILTVLLGIGIVLAIARFMRDERLRALLSYFALGFLMFSGKDTVGWLTTRLPGSDQLLLHRFHNMVQISGLLLAGVAASWLAQGLWSWLKQSKAYTGATNTEAPSTGMRAGLARNFALASMTTTLVVVISVAMLVSAWQERDTYMSGNGTWVDAQIVADAGPGKDFATLVDTARSSGGRIYAGSLSAGSPYKILYAATYMALAHDDAEGVGFTLRTLSLSGDAEVKFNDKNLSHYDLFNIRSIILPSGVLPDASLNAVQIQSLGAWTLWSVRTSGYLRVVDSGPAIVADQKTLGVATTDFLLGDAGANGLVPLIAYAGKPSGLPTRFDGVAQSTPPGVVTVQFGRPDAGVFGGRVNLSRPGVVMLKASFDPNWRATVDGKPVTAQMLAPSFVGVPVPAGQHTIEFKYQSFKWTWVLVLFGALALIALAIVPRRLEQRRGTSAT
ncbi:MAG: hypothetical protein RLY23_1463 [Actinomycetota bacterium]